MAIADFASGFFNALVSLQQKQEENTRADRELIMQQQRQDQAFKQAEMQQSLLKMQLDHEAKMQPLRLEEQKLEIDRAKKLTGDENFARVIGMGNLLRDTERKARLAESSGDKDLMGDVPMLRFQSNYLRDQLKGAMGQLQQGQVPGAQPAGPPPTGQDVPGGADTQRRFMGPTAPSTPTGAVPGEQVPPGAVNAAPMEGTIEFYQSLAGRQPGSEFTTPSGAAFKVFQTEEEVKAENERRLRLQGEFERYRPKSTPIAIAGAEKKVAALQEEQAIQLGKEVERKQDIDVVKTIGNSKDVDFELRSMGSSTRFRASRAEGISFSGVDVRNIGKDRAAFDRMAQQGKMTPTTLRAYDQALSESLRTAVQKGQSDPKAEQWQKELSNALIEASPGEGRINRMGTNSATSLYLTHLNGMLRTIEAGGVVPSFRIRESVPHETVQDFRNSLPKGVTFQVPTTQVGRMIQGKPDLRFAAITDKEAVPEAAAMVSKFSAQISRSLQEVPAGPEREAARAEAARAFDAIAQTQWVGQTSLDVPVDPRLATGPGAGPFSGAEFGFTVEGANNDYRAVKSILGPPRNPALKEAPYRAPRPVGAPGGLMKGGKITSQQKPASEGGGGLPGVIGPLFMAGIMGAPQDVKSFGIALSTVQKAKDRNAAAKSATGDLKTAWGGMTDKEKTDTRAQWTTAKTKWKQWKIDEKYINEVESFINPKKKP